MLLDFLFFLAGLVILYYGAEWLIYGASSIALEYGIRPVVVGLTVVALGTSMPEFLVNAFAAWDGEPDLALGNIIGSNISNIALILGSSALVLPLTVTPQILRKEYPMMLGAMVAFYGFAVDGRISQLDGVLLVTALVVLLAYLYHDARTTSTSSIVDDIEGDIETGNPESPLWKKGMHVAGGTLGLALGAKMMVDSSLSIAHALGVPTAVVGLTIVAIGTSLPELAASMVGAIKSDADLSLGNVLGSNLLNVLFVVGTVSLMSPLDVATDAIQIHFPIMLGFCVLLLPLAWTGFRITRMSPSPV
jgi:cation:H+ antiporter